ncbi:polyprenyl synthetase family protein [Nocardia gamkensis]|uniref:Polyprenyl synthetase family protein n=2 Tax=Nocardia gamkensis TaxID=352869 RepID=A0A7X6R190_9NOCA|nr:polyprenyl synthetase family protein [Nocardia gamkensis]
MPPIRQRQGTTAAELLVDARAAAYPLLARVIGGLPDPLRRMAGYHFGWWDRLGNPASAASGKALRSALVFAAAAACGGPRDAAQPAAAAVELLHNFTLLHDDVIDGDRTRHGRETVWSVWGMPDAVLLGDVLHIAAAGLLATDLPAAISCRAVTYLEAASVELCAGQHEDCAFESREQVLPEEYLRMATGKTGSLMGVSCALGALCAEAEPTTIALFDTFGRELGLAFQIVDDLLGIWGDPMITGKPAGSDLSGRKQSLPVVYALCSDTEAGAELADLYRSDAPMSQDDVVRAAELIEAAGARASAQQLADDHLTKALEVLPDQSAASDLITLAQFSVHRDR